MKEQSTEVSFAEMSAQLAAANPELTAENQEAVGETEPVVATEQIAEFTPTLEDVRSPEVIKQEETQVAEIHAAIRERLAAQEPVRVEAPKQEPFKMEKLSFDTPSVTIYDREIVSSEGFEKSAITEASRGLIEKGKRGELTFEGGKNISPEKLEKLKSTLEASEKEKSQEAFEYVKLSDRMADDFATRIGQENPTKNLNINDSAKFEKALGYKMQKNMNVRNKIVATTGVAALSCLPATMGVAAMGGSVALGMSILLIGAPAILGAGALAWGGKKLYDSYKEKKAAKNFMTASVAKQVRQQVSAPR